MAEKYDDLARSILENVGGAENVASVAHCITRVRFKLKDESRANTAKIEALKGVIQVIQANGQYQVVVGNIVEDVYDAVLEAGNFSGGASADDEPQGDKTVASVIIDLISGIFQPILGPLAAAGIMKGLLPSSPTSSRPLQTTASTRCSTPWLTASSTSFPSPWRSVPRASSA